MPRDTGMFDEMIYDIDLEVAQTLDLRIAYGMWPRTDEEKVEWFKLPEPVRNMWGYVYYR